MSVRSANRWSLITKADNNCGSISQVKWDPLWSTQSLNLRETQFGWEEAVHKGYPTTQGVKIVLQTAICKHQDTRDQIFGTWSQTDSLNLVLDLKLIL